MLAKGFFLMNGDSSLPVGSNVMPMGYSNDITIFFFFFFWGGGGGGVGGGDSI